MCSTNKKCLYKIVSLVVLFFFIFGNFSSIAIAMSDTEIEDLEIKFTNYHYLYKDQEEKIKVTANFADGEVNEVTDFNLEVLNGPVEIIDDKTILPKGEGNAKLKVTYNGVSTEKEVEIVDLEKVLDELKSLSQEDLKEEIVEIKVDWEWQDEGIMLSWEDIPNTKSYILGKRINTDEYKKIEGNLSKTEFFDKDVSPENVYQYKIECIDNDGDISELTEILVPAQIQNEDETKDNSLEVKNEGEIKEGNIAECKLGETVKISDDLIKSTEGNIKFKLIEGDKTEAFEKLWVFRSNEGDFLTPLKDVTFNKNERILTAKVEEEGRYTISIKEKELEIEKEFIDDTEPAESDLVNTDDTLEENNQEIENEIGDVPPESVIEENLIKKTWRFFTFTKRELKNGMYGNDVKDIQNKLLAIGFTIGNRKATSYYGDYTETAVRAIQTRYFSSSLVDGMCGEKTEAKINELYKKRPGRAELNKLKNLEKKLLITVYENKNLHYKMRGNAVKRLQQRLMSFGFDLGIKKPTGYFGDYTKAAVMAVQRYFYQEKYLIKNDEIRGNYYSKTQKLFKRMESKGFNKNKLVKVIYPKELEKIQLNYGSRGKLVRKMQMKLQKLGFDLGGFGVTGYFGKYTMAGIWAVQRVYGKGDARGRYGPWTINKINGYLNEIKYKGTYTDKKRVLNEYKNKVLHELQLDPGEKGLAVKIMQQKLIKLGFNLGNYGATGYFGSFTKAAMYAIQEVNNLSLVGRYGPKTRESLNRMLYEFNKTGKYSNKSRYLSAYKRYTKSFSADDTTLTLAGAFGKDIKYFSQTNPMWKSKAYGHNTMAKSACGPAAMSIVASTFLEKSINVLNMAKYSLKNGFRKSSGTSDGLFRSAANYYGVNATYKYYGQMELKNIKKKLADGNHLVIALMKAGHFTEGGHYIVLTGVDTIAGQNYFTVYDPNAPNPNFARFGNKGVRIIQNNHKGTRVKASTKIFANQCKGYYVFKSKTPLVARAPEKGNVVKVAKKETKVVQKVVLTNHEKKLANYIAKLKKQFKDEEAVKDFISSLTLGVLASTIENTGTIATGISFTITKIVDSMNKVLGAPIIDANRVYSNLTRSKEKAIDYIENYVTDDIGYYLGRLVTDAVIMAQGVAGIVKSCMSIVSGIVGIKASVGGGIGAAAFTGGGSILAGAIGFAASVNAIGVGSAGLAFSASVTGGAAKNAYRSFDNLKKAVKSGKAEIKILGKGSTGTVQLQTT